MILGFITQLNHFPTRFPERILGGLILEAERSNNNIFLAQIGKFIKEYADFENVHYNAVLDEIESLKTVKCTTIREDKKDRWKVGMMIDFFINVRTKKMFRFAPVLPVVSTQKFEIIITENCGFRKRQVWIDDVFAIYYEYGDRIIDKGLLELAQNDGFDTIEDFFAYFNKNFTGKIIHWTDLKY